MNRNRANIPLRRRGFTLIEVLSALLLIAIVMPAVMQGVVLSTRAADVARRRSEAAGLGSSMLSQLVASAQWQGGVTQGDFSPDWPDYRWQATIQPWPDDTTTATLQEIDLVVSWTEDNNRQQSITLSTLAYVKSVNLEYNITNGL